MPPDSILIVGTGAMATLFGYRLAAMGQKICLLGSWPDGLAALRKNGIGLEGAARYAVQASPDPRDFPETKYALVLVKSWQTERVAHQLEECLSGGGLAVTLQNGLGNDLVLSRVLGRARVSRGVTTYGATLVAPGIARPGGEGTVMLEDHPSIGRFEKALQTAGIRTRIVENAEADIWGKLVANSAINPLTALLCLENGELLLDPSRRELLGRLAQETFQVAQAAGVRLPFSDPIAIVEEVVRQTAGNRSSMLQDILRAAPTEVDAIDGAVVKTGEEFHIPTPFNLVMLALVKGLPVNGKIGRLQGV